MTISFFVAGVPIQQGSSRAFVVNGKARVTSATHRDLKGWRQAIAREAQAHSAELLAPPVWLLCEFVMPRPVSTPKRAVRPWHVKTPDADKLLRAVFDAGTGILWRDDALIAAVMLTKCVAAEGEQTGVRITVSRF